MKQNAGENTPLYPPSSNSPRRRQQPGRRRLREVWKGTQERGLGTTGLKDGRERKKGQRARQGHHTAAAAADQLSRTNDKLNTSSFPPQTGNPFLLTLVGRVYPRSTVVPPREVLQHALRPASRRSKSPLPSIKPPFCTLHAGPRTPAKTLLPTLARRCCCSCCFSSCACEGGEVIVLSHPPSSNACPPPDNFHPPPFHIFQD